MTSRVLVLVATIPARRRSCERVLSELARQSRVPDGVVLVLDGYGDEPAPTCALPVVLERRTGKLSGAGNRWRALKDVPADDIVICLDDDVILFQAPHLVRKLAETVERTGAAAAMGRSADGKQAPPAQRSRGELIYGAGCGLAARAGVFAGAVDLAAEVIAAGGPDALGLLGDDDAIVSAHLWKSGVKIEHAAIGNIYAAAGTRSSSQTAARAARQVDPNAQKVAIARVTGWPWPGEKRIGYAAR